MQVIRSIKHPAVVSARKLHQTDKRSECCLLEDVAAFRWAIAQQIPIEMVFITEKAAADPDIIALIEQINAPHTLVSSGIIQKIKETKYASELVAVARHCDRKKTPDADTILVLDNLQDPGNIGTIVRSACAFGINQLVLTSQYAPIFHKKCISASRGTIFQMQYMLYDDATATAEALLELGYNMIATKADATNSVRETCTNCEKPVAFLLGNETLGLSDELYSSATHRCAIPMLNNVESLNVAVAASICLYEWSTKCR